MRSFCVGVDFLNYPKYDTREMGKIGGNYPKYVTREMGRYGLLSSHIAFDANRADREKAREMINCGRFFGMTCYTAENGCCSTENACCGCA